MIENISNEGKKKKKEKKIRSKEKKTRSLENNSRNRILAIEGQDKVEHAKFDDRFGSITRNSRQSRLV